MSDRTPPKVALWLLQQCETGYHAESLAGDLIEEYRRGRSLSWLWLQVAMAVRLAALRFLWTRRWTGVLGASFRLVAELSAVLALVEIVEQNRRTLAVGEMTHLWFIVIAALVINLASIGFSTFTRAFRPKHSRSLAGVLMLTLTLAFGVGSLGVGALTRADTARGSSQGGLPHAVQCKAGEHSSASQSRLSESSASESSASESSASERGASERGQHCRK
jgi:hypothetical protein